MTFASGLTATRQAGAHPLARYRGEFPIFRDKIYLNTCSLGALGERTRRRVAEFLDLWQERGASAWYDVWWAALAELRRRYARVIGATPEEIALGPSISVALASVAEALDYGKRRRVVVTSLDFPTVAYQWLAKRARGIELVVVESGSGHRARGSDRARGGRAHRARGDVPRLLHERRDPGHRRRGRGCPRERRALPDRRLPVGGAGTRGGAHERGRLPHRGR